MVARRCLKYYQTVSNVAFQYLLLSVSGGKKGLSGCWGLPSRPLWAEHLYMYMYTGLGTCMHMQYVAFMQ